MGKKSNYHDPIHFWYDPIHLIFILLKIQSDLHFIYFMDCISIL